ncbi:hypothetical protein LCGC14_1568520, partial [marine sediment metagenome]
SATILSGLPNPVATSFEAFSTISSF